MDKSKIQGLIFYFEHSAELDPGIQATTLEVLGDFLDMIEEQEAAAAKKRKSPNKSGVLQIDPETNKIVAEYATQKEALEAIGKEGKSGLYLSCFFKVAAGKITTGHVIWGCGGIGRRNGLSSQQT